MPAMVTRWRVSLPNTLLMDASLLGTSPCPCIQATLYAISRATSHSMYRSASRLRTQGVWSMGWPFCFVSVV